MDESNRSTLVVEEMTAVRSYRDVAAVLGAATSRQAQHRDMALSQEIGEGPTDAFIGHSVISLHGEEHFKRRRLESRLFTKTARARMELEVVRPALRDLLESVSGGEADLLVLSRLILVRASAAVLGLAAVEDIETADRLRVLAERIVGALAVDYATTDKEELTRTGLEARDAFKREFYDPARAGIEAEDAADDDNLISLLVRNPGSVPSEDVMFREAVLFLVAAATTTTNALPHAVIELERWFEDHPDRRRELASFGFCRRATSETLRLHPPVPTLFRRITEPTVLPSGLELSRDEFVSVDMVASSRDPEAFGDDADEFDPLRKVPDGVWPFGFAFGGGAHMCMGRTLAVGDAGADEDEGSAQGVLTRLLHAVYGAGLALDSERPPVLRKATRKHEYSSFPVRFRIAVG